MKNREPAMKWSVFLHRIHNEFLNGEAFNDFRHSIVTEQDLTTFSALRIREIMAKSYGLKKNSKTLIENVTFRSGQTAEDKKAYSKAKQDRWVFIHDVFAAPDIMIQDPLSPKNFLPIEIKLLKGKGSCQAMATAIGQSLIYNTKYPYTLVFLGVLRSAKWGKYKFRCEANEDEIHFYNTLKTMNVDVITRMVGF